MTYRHFFSWLALMTCIISLDTDLTRHIQCRRVVKTVLCFLNVLFNFSLHRGAKGFLLMNWYDLSLMAQWQLLEQSLLLWSVMSYSLWHVACGALQSLTKSRRYLLWWLLSFYLRRFGFLRWLSQNFLSILILYSYFCGTISCDSDEIGPLHNFTWWIFVSDCLD